MSEASDLECLDLTAAYVELWGVDAALRAGCDVGRGVALVDAALVRGLREWRDLDYHGLEELIVHHGRSAAKALPKLGREARRRLGR